jgi:hypothetical protein
LFLTTTSGLLPQLLCPCVALDSITLFILSGDFNYAKRQFNFD